MEETPLLPTDSSSLLLSPVADDARSTRSVRSHRSYRSVEPHGDRQYMKPMVSLAGQDAIDDELESVQFVKRPPGPCCFKTRRMCVAIICTSCLLFFGVMALITYFAIIPAVVRSKLARATLEFTAVKLSDPVADTVLLSGSGMLLGVSSHGLDCAMSSSHLTVDVLHPSLNTYSTVGWFAVHPPMRLASNGSVSLDTRFIVAFPSGFDTMAKLMFEQPTVTWRVAGDVHLYVTLAGITFNLGEYALSKTMALAGCDGFKNAVMQSFQVFNPTSTGVHINVTMVVHNPSVFTVNPMGDVSLTVFYTGPDGNTVAIGPPATVWSMAIAPGTNVLTGTGILDPSNMTVVQHMIQAYLNEQPSNVTVVAGANASTIPLYAQALQGLTIVETLPGCTDTIITDGVGVANMTEILELLFEYGHIYVPVRLHVNNPMDVDITVVGVTGYVTYNDTQQGEIPMGYITYDIPQGPNITIPANGTSFSEPVPILMLLTGIKEEDDIVKAFIQTLVYNHTLVGINATLHVEIGDSDLYPRVHYLHENIPLYVYYPPNPLSEEAITAKASYHHWLWEVEEEYPGPTRAAPASLNHRRAG